MIDKVLARLIFPAVALSLVSCASAQDSPQLDAAISAHVACLHRQAAVLDDGKSDPLSIAVAIKGACSASLQRVAAETAGYSTYATYIGIRRKLEAHDIELATRVVLQHRHGR